MIFHYSESRIFYSFVYSMKRRYSEKATRETGMHAWRRHLTEAQVDRLNYAYDAAQAGDIQ